MKEELLKLKDSATKIMQEKRKLQSKIDLFNLKVDEKSEELGIDSFFNFITDEKGERLDITKLLNLKPGAYTYACLLNDSFPEIQQIVTSIRKDHPKYGEKRIKVLAIVELNKILTTKDNIQYSNNNLNTLVDYYFLYENCGFFKIKEFENSISELENDAKDGINLILDESKDAAKKVGTSVVNVVKPYGDIAKTQFNDAKTNTKKLINTGSKKLMKLLKDIENKTR